MRTLVFAFLTALAAFALTGPAVGQQTPSPAPIGTDAPNPSTVVHIKNYAYGPATVTIAVGKSVAWVNDDAVSHTVTARDASFDSGNLDQNANYTHTFTKAGTYAYYCAYHTYMKGTVVVK
jgi:plastocyanin